MAQQARQRPRARAAALPPRFSLGLGRLTPSARSLFVGALIAVVAVGGYFVARESSLFAVRTIEIRGAPAPLQARVRQALAPLVGVNLLRLDSSQVRRLVATVPGVSAASYDRDFPHTLRLFVRPEQPVAVLRQGAGSWLVSARGRVIEALARGAQAALPRIWLAPGAQVEVGTTVADAAGMRAVGIAAALRQAAFPARVRFIQSDVSTLSLVLRSGVQVRLGNGRNAPLKLAIARRILLLLHSEQAAVNYLDVSVPERPVAGSNSQVGG